MALRVRWIVSACGTWALLGSQACSGGDAGGDGNSGGSAGSAAASSGGSSSGGSSAASSGGSSAASSGGSGAASSGGSGAASSGGSSAASSGGSSAAGSGGSSAAGSGGSSSGGSSAAGGQGGEQHPMPPGGECPYGWCDFDADLCASDLCDYFHVAGDDAGCAPGEYALCRYVGSLNYPNDRTTECACAKPYFKKGIVHGCAEAPPINPGPDPHNCPKDKGCEIFACWDGQCTGTGKTCFCDPFNPECAGGESCSELCADATAKGCITDPGTCAEYCGPSDMIETAGCTALQEAFVDEWRQWTGDPCSTPSSLHDKQNAVEDCMEAYCLSSCDATCIATWGCPSGAPSTACAGACN